MNTDKEYLLYINPKIFTLDFLWHKIDHSNVHTINNYIYMNKDGRKKSK